MEYISVKQAADKWNKSIRVIQNYCKEGRIKGALKFERSWMIPSNAKIEENNISKDDMKYCSVLLTFQYPVGSYSKRLVENHFENKELEEEFELELAYLKGNFKRNIQSISEHSKNSPIGMCSIGLSIINAISIDDYYTYKTAMEQLEHIKMISNGNDLRIAELTYYLTAYSGMATENLADWLKNYDFSGIDPEIIPTALYVYVKFLQSKKRYHEMFAVTKTYLALHTNTDTYTSIDIYMRILCAVACNMLNYNEDGIDNLKMALSMAEPYDYVTPFAELYIYIDNFLKECITEKNRSFYTRICKQNNATWKNWLSFHNHITKDNITTILTYREYKIAIALKYDMKYSDIARNMGISIGRVRNIISDIYSKLYISSRKEIKEMIL